MAKEIRLNAFEMNCVAHQSPGMWRHPRDRSRDYRRLDGWIELAKTLERGLFDGLFLADVLGVYDVFGGSPKAALLHATQTPVNDPLLLVPAMAAATKHLGFGVNLAFVVRPETFVDMVDLLVPELQRRRRYKTAYTKRALREKLFGKGARLGAERPAGSHRSS